MRPLHCGTTGCFCFYPLWQATFSQEHVDRALMLHVTSQVHNISLTFCHPFNIFPSQRSTGGLSIPLCAFQGTVSLQAPTGKTLSLSTYEVSSDGLKISPDNAKKVTQQAFSCCQ